MSFGHVDLGRQAQLREAMKHQQIKDRIGNTYACAQNLFITGFQEIYAKGIVTPTITDEELNHLADLSLRAAKLINNKIAEDSKHYAKIIAQEYKYVEPGSEG